MNHLTLSKKAREKQKLLMERAQKNYYIHPDVPNFLRFEWMNVENKIDTVALNDSAFILFDAFKYYKPDIVVAIGKSGIPLGRVVGSYFKDSEYCEIEKLSTSQLQTHDASKFIETFWAHSYSKNIDMQFAFPKRVWKGKTVLLIDDFLARADIFFAVYDVLQKHGATLIGVGVNADKRFQGGFEKVNKIVPCFSVLPVAAIDNTNKTFTFIKNERE